MLILNLLLNAIYIIFAYADKENLSLWEAFQECVTALFAPKCAYSAVKKGQKRAKVG